MRHPARVVAFTGIDGSGKSSVIQALQASSEFVGYTTFKKNYHQHARRVRQSFPLEQHDSSSYIGHPFGLGLARAYALDFVDFYRREVSPYFLRGRRIFLDRWSPCVAAMAMMCEYAGPEIERALNEIPRPDVVFHLQVSPSEARNRIELRGEPKPDEDIGLLGAFARSYDRVFERLVGWPVIRLENRLLEDTVAEVRSYLL